MSARTLNESKPMNAVPGLRTPRLRPLCQAIALMLATSAAMEAHAATNLGNLGAQMSAARAAAAASGQVNLGVSPQQAALQTQVSLQNLSHAAQGLAQQMAAQQAAAAAGLGAASNVPNGLAVGGLQVAPGVSFDPHSNQPTAASAGSNLWINANGPTQSVDGNGHVTVDVQQTAQKAIVTWQTMNVGKQTTLNFDQSGGAQANGTNNWVVLNRIVDPSGAPSQILGNITAQGSVYVINRNGVIFGAGSQVNVNSLIASSLDLFSSNIATSNNRFLTGGIGDLNTTNVATNSILLTTDSPAAGDITIAPGASIALGNQGLGVIAAPNVTNEGIITAPSGQVALVAGIGVSYDYNFSSLFAGDGSKPQGSNDNSTTMLRFANYGKLTDAGGNDITPVGTLLNDGSIITPRGNITLLGGAVEQNGAAVATTSVAQPGSIVISSLYEVGANRGSLSPSDEGTTNFYTGAVSFGPKSITAILPDSNGVTLPSDPTSLAPFQTPAEGGAFTIPLPTQGLGLIEVLGAAIDFQGGSLTYAPGQTIAASAIVLQDPRTSVPVLPDAGRVLLESGATLDVSGIPNTELSMASNLLTVTLAGNELADDPLQRNGFLNDASVTVDMGNSGVNPETGEPWVGTPLANLESYANLVQRSIGQLLMNGGQIDLSGNEVIGEAGSTINLMGGYLHYLGGTVNTTRLVDSSGVLVSIGAANPNDIFVGLAGEFVESHPRWGATKTWFSPLLNQGVFEGDYIVGGNAGTLNIEINADSGVPNQGLTPLADSGALVLDSTILAGDVAGSRQVESGLLPTGGNFLLSTFLPIEITDPGLPGTQPGSSQGVTPGGAQNTSSSALSLPAGFTSDSPLLATQGSDYAKANVLDAQTLDRADFSTINLTAGTASGGAQFQPITEDAGASLSVQPGGSITMTGAATTINGALTARGGTISITANLHNDSDGTVAVPGDIVIGSGAVLDVSGFFVNESAPATDPSASALSSEAPALPIDAGSISLFTPAGLSLSNPFGGIPPAGASDLTGNITLAAGSLLDLESGARVLPNGKLQTGSNGVPLGTGGNLTLETYAGLDTPLDADLPPPTRGFLSVNGTIDALGFTGGGTLTLEQGSIQIGGDPTAAALNTYYFDPVHWGALGFGSFVLNSPTFIDVPAGATIRLQHSNLLTNSALVNAPSGADPAAFTSAGLLTGTLASPTNLSVTAGLETKQGEASANDDAATLGEGALIQGDPGASVSLTSYAQTDVLGSINAPGGTISLSMSALQSTVASAAPLYIGPDSVLDVSGVVVNDPLSAPVRTSSGFVSPVTGTIYAGGTINLTDIATPIVVAPGAVLNVSGTAGEFDVAQLIPGGFAGGGQVVLDRQPQWSNAGQVNIETAEGLVFEGSLIGQAGAPQAAGGSLTVTDVAQANGIFSYLVLVQDTAQALAQACVTLDLSVIPASHPGLSITQIDPALAAGQSIFGVDALDGSGFDNVTLNGTGGGVGFSGQVSLSARNSVVFNLTTLFGANIAQFLTFGEISNPAPNTSLTVNAPYVAINGTSANSGGFPSIQVQSLADATLTINAGQIDLSAFFGLGHIGQTTFNSTGDIRLMPASIVTGTDAPLIGYLEATGNVSFNAADVYPATDTAFVIQSTAPNGTITFGYPQGVVPSVQAPLSAGGAILVSAADIVQDGTIRAPFGDIILGAAAGSSISTTLGTNAGFVSPVGTQSVELGAGSVTSVSADGAVIPFGSTTDQTTWSYNPGPNNPTWSGASANALPNPLSAAPQGVVTLNGASVAFDAGAVVDVSGGGDLQAQEWIPGTGGSRDVLSQFNTSFVNSAKGTQVPLYADGRQIYSIVPGYTGKVAPYDAALNQSGVAVGQQIYLAGGAGLPAGFYTLLPAKYATQPGAFRVVVNSGVVNPLTNQTTVLPDGTMDMSGYLTSGFNGAHPSTVSQFMVQSASTWEQYSQYAMTSANSFFPSYAALNGQASPYVPDDAGRLVLSATSGLTLGGKLMGDPGPGGLGGQVDISSQFLQVVGDGEAVDPGYLGISASALDELGAASLLIGGTRHMTDAGTVITPTANGVIISNDVAHPLTGQEILLVAAPQFQSTTITLDNEGDTTSIMTPIAGTGLVSIRNGSVIQATGSGSDVGGETFVMGNTLQTLPVLPGSIDQSVEGSAASTIVSYYQTLDAALGTLVLMSSGAPATVQLPSAAQISPTGIPVQDAANNGTPFTIALPSLAGAASGTGAVIESGARLDGGNVLTLDTTGDNTVQSGALLAGNNFFAISSAITFAGPGAAPASGMVIDANLLSQLEQSASVNLQSYGAIAFQGDVNIAMAKDGSTLTLGGGSLSSDGGQVSIAAPTLVLDNSSNAPVPGTLTAGSGSLSVDVGQLVFSDGAKSTTGFGSVNLTAHQAVVGEGTGSMNFGALPVTLQTPTVIADTSSNQLLMTTGALSAVPIDGSTPANSTAVGGAITLEGGSVSVAVPIQAQAGNIRLQSSAGDVTVSGTGELIAHGMAKTFGDTTEYASAGMITLSATQGTVDLQSGSVVDFAGAAGGGDGGSLTIGTTGSTAPVQFNGTLLGVTATGYAGSVFNLNTSGAVALDDLAQKLTVAGINGGVSIETAQGDLSLSRTLTASSVDLTADGGGVSVTGAIVANGTPTASGEIQLYGTTGVDVEGALTATGSPNSQKPGGLIDIGTTGTGSTTSLNAVYGYENVDPSASGTITIGSSAVIDASGGTIALRAPILDALNAQGSNVNIAIAPGAQIRGGAVFLDAYAVWSTADQSTNATQHFDGIIDPAGWYTSSGTLVAGSFKDIDGNPVASWDGTTLTNQDGTTNNLSFYLSGDYFTPNSSNADHAVFYGGYDTNSATFNPASPDAGSLPAFVQQPGFQFGSTFSGVANFIARPEIDLLNPAPAQGGTNGGNISVLSNWNLGAGVLNPDGSTTLAYRYQGTIAPVLTLRAAGDVRIDASISDGFFQTASVTLPSGGPGTVATGPATFDGAETSFNALAGGPDDLSSLTQIGLFDGTTELLGTNDPNVVLAAPQPGGSMQYYQDYQDYIAQLYTPWATDFPFNQGFFQPITPAAAGTPEPVAPPMSDVNYASDYGTYLTAYNAWLQANFTAVNVGVVGTPPAPAAPLNTAQYEAYVSEDASYISYAFASLFNGTSDYIFAPVAPALILPGTVAPPAVPASANLPSNMGTAADPLPVQFASLVAGQSTSYRIVAGAVTASANPLAVVNPDSAARSPAGQGNVLIDGHLLLMQLNGTQAEIAVPTVVRTGTGSIDIAASNDFELLDQLAPGVVYTAGTPVQAPIGGDTASIALGQGAFNPTGGNPPQPGISTILTSEVNPVDAGNITLEVGGDILGFQKVTDTLAAGGSTTASGLDNKPGAFLGQFWLPWLLTNPKNPDVPWYVNFGSFDQGIMSIGGDVTVTAGGDIHDLAVSLPTTSYLDGSNTLHVTGGGDLSVTAGGSIYSGDYYVGQGAGSIRAGGAIASDFTYESKVASYPVETLLAVQYGTIDVQARQSVDIGGVYDPTYLMDFGPGVASPVSSYQSSFVLSSSFVPYVTSMSTDSAVSIQSTGGDLSFNSLAEQAALFSLGGAGLGIGTQIFDPAISVSSLLLPASLNLVALEGEIQVEHGGGLYPSATGTLTLIAGQSIDLAIPVLVGPGQFGGTQSQLTQFASYGNISGTSLGKLDYLVGTGILPTGADPTLIDASQLTPTQARDPSLVGADATASVTVYSQNGSLVDGTSISDDIAQASSGGGFGISLAGKTIGQISLVPNAPAQVFAGEDILDLPFFGENFSTDDITSLIAGRDIRYNPLGNTQPAAIELAGPGTLDVEAGRNLNFQAQPVVGTTETGIRTIGNSIDTDANPGTGTVADEFFGQTFLSDFGNPYLPRGGATVTVLFGVAPGIDKTDFINQYINPANAAALAGPVSSQELVSFVDQYEAAAGGTAPQTVEQAWAVFQTLPENQQQLLVERVFIDVLNDTGKDFNDPASPFFQQYARGYQAINTLFPADLGYTANSLGGGANGANQTVSTGNFDMRSSTVQTQQGGDVDIFGPGGRILVGSSTASPATDPASQGILTLEQGNIATFTDTDVLVAQSRVMTEQGGNILMWSSNGNLDAGKGAKTSVSAPPPLYACDIDFFCTVDIKGVVSGAGIATLQSLPDVPVGDANLIAPRGTVDAGAAGIRVSGNLNVAALHVANVDNIQVQGKTTGIPVVAAVDTGALTAASAATSAVTQMAQNLVRSNASGVPQRHWIISVQVEGFGDSNDDSGGSDTRKKRRPSPVSYNPSSEVTLLGFGGVGKTQRAFLTEEERSKLGGI